MNKKIIYIAHPISGDLAGNINSILNIIKLLSIENKVIPFAPYIVDVLALDDNDPSQRAIGFSYNEHLFRSGIIDEVWLYGGRISSGMQQEIDWANELGIEVKKMW